jgi:hypothetical protein
MDRLVLRYILLCTEIIIKKNLYHKIKYASILSYPIPRVAVGKKNVAEKTTDGPGAAEGLNSRGPGPFQQNNMSEQARIPTESWIAALMMKETHSKIIMRQSFTEASRAATRSFGPSDKLDRDSDFFEPKPISSTQIHWFPMVGQLFAVGAHKELQSLLI